MTSDRTGLGAKLFGSHVPFQPKAGKLYYGWWVLASVIVVTILTAPGQTAGISPFVEDLIELTGFGRQGLAIAYMVGTLVSGCCLPFAGRFIDLWGSRLVVILAGLGLAVTLVWMSLGDQIFLHMGIQLYQQYPWIGMTLLVFGFFCMRFCGQGVMILAGQTTTPRWFKKRRGLATGIAGFVAALINPMAPLLLKFLIDGFGWRGAWLVAAGILVVVNTLVVWVIWRDTPESCDLPIDGVPAETDEPDPELNEGAWTRREAIVVPTFWVVVLSNAMLGLIITAISFHIVDLGALRGISEDRSLAWYLPMTWTAMVVGLLANFLADYLSYRIFLPLMQIFLGLALVVLEVGGHWWGFYGSAALMGLGISMAGPVGVTTFPRWFGRVHLGAITGVNWATVVIGSALGPTLYSMLKHDETGYALPGRVCMFVLVVLLILGSVLRAPKAKAIRREDVKSIDKS